MDVYVDAKREALSLKEAMAKALQEMCRRENIPVADFLAHLEPIFQVKGYRNSTTKKWQKILVLRLDEIGDSVLTSGFLRELRRNYPQAQIDLVVKPVAATLMQSCPYVDSVRSLTPWSMPVKEWLVRAMQVAEQLFWPMHYDACLLPRWDVDLCSTAILAYLSGARERIGFSEHVHAAKERMNRGYDGFLTRAICPPPYIVHEVEKANYFLRSLGLTVQEDFLECWGTQRDFKQAKMVLAGKVPLGREVLSVSLGAREMRKTYPPELLGRALQNLLPQRLFFVLLGGRQEIEAGHVIEQALPEGCVLNLAGKTSLQESAAFIAASRVYLGGDTGLTHIAAAVHVPIVEWFNHPMDVPVSTLSLLARFYPWKARAIVLRPPHALDECSTGFRDIFDEMAICKRPNESHCICGIAPEQIARAVRMLLGETVQGGNIHAD